MLSDDYINSESSPSSYMGRLSSPGASDQLEASTQENQGIRSSAEMAHSSHLPNPEHHGTPNAFAQVKKKKTSGRVCVCVCVHVFV
jgi:hypothetical protein